MQSSRKSRRAFALCGSAPALDADAAGQATGGMTICYLAGALGPISVATIGALVGGKDVVSALESCVKILVKRD